MSLRLKPILFGLAALILTASAPSSRAAQWLTDLQAAKAQAAREGKSILVNFTGSDWCGWCIRLRNEVFDKPEFWSFAGKHLVLVEIDFPRRSALAYAQKKANQDLARTYNVQGYPTILLLNPKGGVVGRTGYKAGGPVSYVKELAGIINVSYDPSAAPGPSQSGTLYGGAKIAPPPAYAKLELKGISGAKSRKFALLNNQTLAEGESARVKLGDGEVRVRCEEIRENSIVVTVNGEERKHEIFLDAKR